jgi:hypothetical protein
MRVLLLILSLLLVRFSNGQEMAYKFGHLFKRSLSSKGTLYVVQEGTATRTDVVGKINANELILISPADASQTLRNSTDILLRNQATVETKTYTPKTINSKLKGVIQKRSKDGNNDTLLIRFWDITNEPATFTANAAIVNSTNNGQDFIFVINPTYWATHRVLQIPYRTWQFTATNLPFRILTKSGDLEAEFLNANVSFIKTFGHTKIYQSEFVVPRNWSLSVGPYLGLTAIDNPSATNDNKKEFGLNYGLNGIYAVQNFNITAAFGFQNGFKEQTRSVQPYIGFGVGFKLVEFFTPEIKDKEQD